MKWKNTYDKDGYLLKYGLKEKLSDLWDEFGGLAIMIVLLVGLLSFCVYFENMGCKNAYKNSGLSSQFNIWSGCMVEVQPNQWIPSDNYIFVQSKGE
jgi:hypothetical protein